MKVFVEAAVALFPELAVGAEPIGSLFQAARLEVARPPLRIATTNELLGSITEADLKVLVDALEEESLQDQDYYIDSATIDVIADGKATEHLIALLRKALGARDGVDIRWQRR